MTGDAEPLRLSLIPELRSLPAARKLFRSWLDAVGAEDADDVVLAVHEAVANAVEHAGLSASEVITVEAEVIDDVLRVLVRDSGRWRQPPVDGTRGRGLVIMRTVMDRVQFEHLREGTSIEMSRRLR
jgi:serine/threonine-protein kinase RsbW